MKYLYPFECEKLKLSSPAELQSAIDGNRREGRRPSYDYNFTPMPNFMSPHHPHMNGGMPGGLPNGLPSNLPGGPPGGLHGGLPGGMPGGFNGLPGGLPVSLAGGLPGMPSGPPPGIPGGFHSMPGGPLGPLGHMGMMSNGRPRSVGSPGSGKRNFIIPLLVSGFISST